MAVFTVVKPCYADFEFYSFQTSTFISQNLPDTVSVASVHSPLWRLVVKPSRQQWGKKGKNMKKYEHNQLRGQKWIKEKENFKDEV